MRPFTAWIMVFLLCLATAGQASAKDITLFAAASLKGALDHITTLWQHQSGHRVQLSYAATSILARQIAQGAPADIFFAANAAWMDDLAARGLLAEGSRRDLLGNRLVIIAPRDTRSNALSNAHSSPSSPALRLADLPERLGDRPFAMALVSAVPAGLYGKQALQSLGLWNALAPRVVQASNARAALALVAIGEAPYGLVYATDAKAEPRVQVVAQIPTTSHEAIRYPVAALTATPPALDLTRFLGGAAAKEIFRRHGFILLPRADSTKGG